MTDTTTSGNEPEEILDPFGSAALSQPADDQPTDNSTDQAEAEPQGEAEATSAQDVEADPVDVMFQAPDLSAVPPAPKPAPEEAEQNSEDEAGADQQSSDDQVESDDGAHNGDHHHHSESRNRKNRRKRRRGGRSRNRDGQGNEHSGSQHGSGQQDSQGNGGGDTSQQAGSDEAERRGNGGKESGHQNSGQGPEGEGDSSSSDAGAEENGEAPVIRKKRRRRRGSSDMEIEEDSDDGHTVTRIRSGRDAGENAPAKVTGVKGSTRLEAKRQRRRHSRDGGRRRGIITEAEFLARRESVDRKMIVRQRGERIQIGVLEDGVLAEHYVSHTTQDSLIGNVYLGKVQNVLPSMEAAFVDIGRGRNAVLYAGEVDWDAANIGNAPRKIENALKSGDPVLVQVTKDPVGHKGARLTSQVSLPGRYLVFVPGGSMTGISRKLPDTERSRLKKILKEQMPDNAGVIVRTAAEGASEEELTNDINRLRALWETIQSQAHDRKVLPPELLYAEPDLTIKVVRDVFNEDFSSMEIQGEETWDNVEAYVTYVAPHLLDRCHEWKPEDHDSDDIFAHHRIDEQLNKALDRNVKLPSGGSLVFDRTEAMTVVDVNTGKFTGSGGNLEETVTKNNLEAAEEIVRQLRLRDIGGIIVIDFIDMVLESNRDLVLRRLVECLGRDRTKHQVAEVTSLGLVQMTRKRMGTGLLEVFSTECEHCAGRGIMTHPEPVEHRPSYTASGDVNSGKNSKKRKKRKKNQDENSGNNNAPDPKELKKLEKASKGMAQVAAATNGNSSTKSGDQAEKTGHQPDAGQKKSGGQPQGGEQQKGSAQQKSADHQKAQQNKGNQNKGTQKSPEKDAAKKPQGQQDKTAETESAPDGDKAVLTIAGEPVEVPRGEAAEKSAEESTAGEKPEAAPALDALDEALSSRSGGSERRGSGSGRRRRRAAGSAQGASGEVQHVESSSSGVGQTFAAESQQPAEEKEKAAEEPVMLGVGVKAEDISRTE